MAQNPNYIPKNNPIRSLLHAAVKGERLTKQQLDALDAFDDQLPPGAGIGRFKAKVQAGANQVAALGAQGDNHKARQLADELAAQIAPRMSDEARSLTGSTPDSQKESLDDLAKMAYDN